MDWQKNKQVRLCQNFLGVFAGLLAGLDIAAFWLCRWFVGARSMPDYSLWLMLATVYLASIPAWFCLVKLGQLLLTIRMGEVFVEENVGFILGISRCCGFVALITALSAFYYVPFIFVAAAALFLFLLVRIVAEIFREASSMKDELDLTV